MYTLYHHLADPFSRKVRLMLAEKGLEFTTKPAPNPAHTEYYQSAPAAHSVE